MRSALFLGCALALCACPTVSTLGSARTLDKGRTQVAVGLSSLGSVYVRQPQGGRTPPLAANAEVAVRHGVRDGLELGGRLWGSGLMGEARLGLLRSDGQTGFDLALHASLGVVYFPLEGMIPSGLAQFAVLGGYNVSGTQVFGGVRAMDRLLWYQGPINTLNVGLTVGVSIQLTDTLRLVPELTALAPVASSANDIIVQSGIGVLFGG